MRSEHFNILSPQVCFTATYLIRTLSHTPTPPSLLKQVETKTKQEIRKVDFANLSNSAEPIFGDDKTFRLENGVFESPPINPAGPWPLSRSETISLVAVAYGDVTGDDIEEAIVVMFEDVTGTAIPYFAYIFAIEKEQPKLLWAFATGDRAQGGLRRAYAENSELVVELYGKDLVSIATFTLTPLMVLVVHSRLLERVIAGARIILCSMGRARFSHLAKEVPRSKWSIGSAVKLES